MSQFDENGLIVDRYDEILNKTIADLKSVWGDGIKTDPQSVIGQFLAIFSEAIADQNELIEAVANIFDPGAAEGVFLSELVRLNGITRNENLFSTGTLQVTANAAGSTIPAGSIVSDPNVGDKFATDVPVVVAPSGNANVSATAVEPGAIAAPAGTLTKIETPVFGWASVTNPADFSVGRDEETDTELRIRRQNAAEKTGIGTPTAIKAALADISGVNMVALEVNNTASAIGSLPPQHIRAVVNGGNDADIAETLFNNVAAGIGYFGNTSYVYNDPESGDAFTIKWDRPTEIEIYIAVNLTTNANFPATGVDDIEAALVAYFENNLGLGDTVFQSRMYTPVNETPGHTVNSLYIDTSPGPISELDIPIAINQVARTSLTSITVVTT